MERTSPDVRIVRAVEYRPVELDKRLPTWARRSNPIIRRQLGLYWKTILPETGFLVKIILLQAGLIVATLPLPFLFDLALPTITASILLFPVAIYMYIQLMLAIGYTTSVNVADEVRNDTFTLLRATPMSLQAILASKIAAAIWRQVENLSLLIIAAALFSLPILISHYATLWPLDENPVLARVGMVLGLIVSLVRLLLETLPDWCVGGDGRGGAAGAFIGSDCHHDHGFFLLYAAEPATDYSDALAAAIYRRVCPAAGVATAADLGIVEGRALLHHSRLIVAPK